MRKVHTNKFAGLLIAAAFVVLGGCGGGSGGGSTSGSGGAASSPVAVAATAASIQLLESSPQMPSSGTSPVTLTAIVLDAHGQAISGRTVSFSKGADSSAYFSSVSNSGVSDANGLVTAVLNLGSNKSNRTISISATADSATASNSVAVTGTTIAISGNSSLAFGAATTLTINVRDSAGVALQGASVTVSSANGNPVVLSQPTTDASGSITATVTATNAGTGTDVITAAAAGATKTQTLTISTASFAFTTPSPSTTTQINLNTATPISVLWKNAGAAVVGSAVTFTATRGTITGSPAITNAGGTATASISSAAAGPAIVTAAGPGGTPAASINVNFVATTATNVTIQANPSTIQPTTGAAGQTSNISTLSAVVRDAQNNLVQNARINFAITADQSGGTLSAATAVTDSTGTASVNYIAGATSSGANGVTISATPVDISGVPIAPAIAPKTVSLTVGGTALFVRLGTDNTVASSPPTNTKTYVALVTDSAGNPQVNTTVRFTLRPGNYMKGSFTWNGTLWVPTQSTAQPCLNEDINFNGILGPTSASGTNLYGILGPGAIPIATNDFNGNGRLDPGNVASVNATATTDAQGFATATISYPKNYSYWADVTLEARAGVVGNDPPATANFTLSGPASDYNNVSVAPPGQTSPFGTANTCSNPN